MTVAELIEILCDCPPEAAVFVRVGSFRECVDIDRVRPTCVQIRNTDSSFSRWEIDPKPSKPLPLPDTQQRRAAVELDSRN